MSRQIRSLPLDQISGDDFLQTLNTRHVDAWDSNDAQNLLREPGEEPEVFDQLFDRFDFHMDARFSQSAASTAQMDLVLLHGKNVGLSALFDRIGDVFKSLDVYRSKVLAFRSASQRVGHKTVFAVDLDTLGHIDKAVPKLMHLRQMNPMLPVVLFSSDFHRDDLSGERHAIADASIRLPANAAGILRGIGYAINNSRRRQGI
jgi:hypothetical protein